MSSGPSASSTRLAAPLPAPSAPAPVGGNPSPGIASASTRPLSASSSSYPPPHHHHSAQYAQPPGHPHPHPHPNAHHHPAHPHASSAPVLSSSTAPQQVLPPLSQLNGMHPGVAPPPTSILSAGGPGPSARGAPVESGPPGGPSGPAAGGPAIAAAMPGAPPPGMMAPAHPSAARLNDLLEFVKAEFEQVAGEGGMLRAQKDEYEAMIHSHAAELNAMRAMAYDLERKYHDDKRVLQDENSRLQDEVTRVRQQLDSARTSVSSSTPANNGPGLAPVSANVLPPNSRPTLPSLMAGGSTPQPPSLNRPASTGPAAHSVGMFGGGAAAQIGEREREYVAQYNGNGRDQSAPIGDHPNKRSRLDDDDRRKPLASQRHSSALPSYASVGPIRPSSTGPHPPSSAPGGPQLHHPSPLPPSNGLPPISTSAPSPAPQPPSQQQPAVSKPDEKPSTVEVTNFDPETAPKDLKKEGSDWMTMFNPNVKRVLDVGLVHTLVHDSVVCCVRFSPDGKMLATGCNRNTTLYDTKTGAKISTLFDESSGINNDNYIRSASFSPDGKYLATGSEDRIVRIWNLAQERIYQVFQGHKSEIYSLAFSPDGRRLVSGSGDKTARMWDLETGACLFTLAIDDITIAENGPVDAGVTSVVLSPDGKFLAAGSLDTVVRIWDADNGQLVDKLKGHKDSVYSVAFSPDGKFLVSGSLDKTLKMWDMASLRNTLANQQGKDVPVGEGGKTNCLTTLQGHKDYVLSVDISPDGAWIVSGSKDRGVQFWDPKTAKAQFMLQGHKNSVISVAVSDAGGLVATGSGDWSARIWSYDRIA
ncbi:uncharacterized protein JCM15063_003982 [Sporobolomyces koalae]|uniref:uncharacterized protein n=1 Tax=Sporobolomyces koalae TaxID=500713 RepID=UPI00318053C2